MRRLRTGPVGDDGGFTLIELLVAMTLGLILAVSALTILDVTIRRTGEVNQRVDSDQRGRTLMDLVTRDLRSQICQTNDIPPIRQTTKGLVGGHYQESVSFYADMTDGRADGIPDLRTLTFDETNRTLTEDVSRGASTGGTIVYAAPYLHRVIGSNVIRDAGNDVFTYFAFNTPPAGTAPTPSRQLTSPMAVGATDTTIVARIGVRFSMLPTGLTTQTRTSTAFVDDVYVRAADPNDPAPIPTCA